MKIFSKRWPCFSNRFFKFAPPLVGTLALLVIVPLCVRLGVWQLSRAAENQAILDQYTTRVNAAAITLPLNEKAVNAHWRFTPVKVTGHFLNQENYLLDNAVVDHHVGYRMLRVFAPNGRKAYLLVDQGFVRLLQSRENLPMIAPIRGEVTLQGILDNPYRPAYRFNAMPLHGHGQLLQEIDLEAFAKYYQKPFYPFVFLNSKTALSKPADKTLMHRGYAGQWFSFAVTFLVIYVAVNLKR